MYGNMKARSDVTKNYQTIGLEGNLPVFYKQLEDKPTFPLARTSGKYTDFNRWRQTAKAKVLEHIVLKPDYTPFDPVIIDEQDRRTYFARKVVFNLTAESRVLGLMLVPKGKGPFPAVLLLHDHGAEFDISKEKVIEPWGDEAKLESARIWTNKLLGGRFIGNELVARGYAVLAVDAWAGAIAGSFNTKTNRRSKAIY